MTMEQDWQKQLSPQLSILHATGNIHGDIKPKNIMLRDKTINPDENGGN